MVQEVFWSIIGDRRPGTSYGEAAALPAGTALLFAHRQGEAISSGPIAEVLDRVSA